MSSEPTAKEYAEYYQSRLDEINREYAPEHFGMYALGVIALIAGLVLLDICILTPH